MTSCVFFSSLLARCLTINGFLARFTWTGGPWWTMQCRIGTHRWSRFVQRNNIGKCPLLSLLLQVLFHIGSCSLAQNIRDNSYIERWHMEVEATMKSSRFKSMSSNM